MTSGVAQVGVAVRGTSTDIYKWVIIIGFHYGLRGFLSIRYVMLYLLIDLNRTEQLARLSPPVWPHLNLFCLYWLRSSAHVLVHYVLLVTYFTSNVYCKLILVNLILLFGRLTLFLIRRESLICIFT